MPEERELVSRSEGETRWAGEELAGRIGDGEVILLTGDLGSGKTVFTQGVAAGLGVAVEEVQSPTYTLIHEYPAGASEPRMVHVDLYRLTQDAVESLGLDEVLAGPGVKVVEWADRLARWPDDAWMITIEQIAAGRRRILIRRHEGCCQE